MTDIQLWTASLGDKEIRAWTRNIHARQDSSDLFGVELRITKNGELYLSEIFRDYRKLHARSMELFEKVVAKGFKILASP
jgi:hypothetical protein